MTTVVESIGFNQYITLVDHNAVAKPSKLGMVHKVMVNISKVGTTGEIDASIAETPEVAVVNLQIVVGCADAVGAHINWGGVVVVTHKGIGTSDL